MIIIDIFPDQDAINSIFAGDIKYIDAKFNIYDITQDLSGCVIHMYRIKPWKVFTGAAHEKLYWNIFLATEWGRDITHSELIDILADKAALLINTSLL